MLQRFKSIWKPVLIIAVIIGGLAYLSNPDVPYALIFGGSVFLGITLLILILNYLSPTKFTLDQRIDQEFPLETREAARGVLNRLTLINKEVVIKRILDLAKGNVSIIENLVKSVDKEDDYREALISLDLIQRLDMEFSPETREATGSLLNRLASNNKEIVQGRILDLAKGDMSVVENLVQKVEKEGDFREALMLLQ